MNKPLAERVRELVDNGEVPHGSIEECNRDTCGSPLWCEETRTEKAELSAIAEELERLAGEMRSVRAEYGELVPFDPNCVGFDDVITRPGQRRALCRMMNAVLNHEWADQLAPRKDVP